MRRLHALSVVLAIGTLPAPLFAPAQAEGQKKAGAKLGDAVEISLSAKDPARSAAFYEQLGFQRTVNHRASLRPEITLTDGVIKLGLYKTAFPSPTLTYFSVDARERIKQLQEDGILLRVSTDDPTAMEFTDPNGLRVVLAPGPPSPPGQKPERKSLAKCGEFGELAVNTKSLQESSVFWEKLGFKKIASGEQPYPFGIFSDGRMLIGLHQGTDFSQPHITYFSPDAPARIKQLKLDGLLFTNETKDAKGEINGGTLAAPDGQRIFVFNE